MAVIRVPLDQPDAAAVTSVLLCIVQTAVWSAAAVDAIDAGDISPSLLNVNFPGGNP